MKATPTTKARILSKLQKGESLSTKDFKDLGYSFELFLRYCTVPESLKKQAEQALMTQLGAAQ